jgi:hypothetical protein
MTEPTTKRRIDIEKLLQWAYLDELPKLKLSAAEGIWDQMAQYGSLGGINAEQSRFWGSGAQRYAQFGLPHPDAEKIARAVGALKPASIEDDFDVIVGELGALVTVNDFRPRRAIRVPGRTTEAAAGVRPARRHPGAHDQRRAACRLSRRDALAPRLDERAAASLQTPAAHGRRPKIVGECRGRNLYTAGSYCPLRWSPSPIEVVLGRADYRAWRAALIALCETLELEKHVALAPPASASPWLACRWLDPGRE